MTTREDVYWADRNRREEERHRMAMRLMDGELKALQASLNYEIREEGISLIVFGDPYEAYRPAGTRVKWFRDELGQLWVKFDVAERGSEVLHYVMPAERVDKVLYKRDQ